MPKIPETRIDIKFLKNKKLLSDGVIRELIVARKMFITKSTTTKISKEVCVALIQLELHLMKISNTVISANYTSETSYINESINVITLMSNRIDHLYYSMFQMFSIECMLLIEYMEFQSKYIIFITNEVYPLVVLMSNKKCEPQMFIAAGTFQYEKHNINSARQYFEEGIKKYKDNKSLHLEQLWIEVMYLSDIGGGEQDERIAIQTYKNIINTFKQDMEFHILLLERAIEVKPIRRLQYEIVCDFMELYKQSDVMWHKVATLCTKGFIFDHVNSSFGYVTDFKERARCCILTYNEGLKHVLCFIKKRNLMKLLTEYIVNLWKYNKDINNLDINILVKTEMKKAFQIGHFDLGGLHKSEYYVYWAVIPDENRFEILQLAINHNKDNVLVWTEVLKYHITHFDNYRLVKTIFDIGNHSLENKSLLLWKIMDSYLQQYGDIAILGKFYETGANSPYNEISVVLKVDYLEWRHMYHGIASARELFNQLINLKPDTKKLYMNMIGYEKLQRPIDVNIIRNLYNITCLKFCRQGNDVGLWAECIEFELAHVGSFSAERIYNTALKNAYPQFRSDLRRMYRSICEAHSRHTVTIQPVIIEISDEDD